MRSRTYPSLGCIHFPPEARAEIDFIYNEIVRDREYLQHGVALQPGDTVFDVGANVGVFALFVARECQEDFTLYCFEPIPETFRCLQRNLTPHERYPDARISLFNRGLTRLGGRQHADFTYFPRAPGNSTMFAAEKESIFQSLTDASKRSELITRLVAHNPWRLPMPSLTYRLLSPFVSWRLNRLDSAFRDARSTRCQLTTIAAICEEHKVETIDLLKVDVEGAELEVLEGMNDQVWNMTRQVVLELHDVDGRLSTIKSMLAAHGILNIAVVKPSWAEICDLNAYTVYAHRPGRLDAGKDPTSADKEQESAS